MSKPPERLIAELTEQYEVEKFLADKLRRASRQERTRLYSQVYDELFRRIPHHPQLKRKSDVEAQRAAVENQMSFLTRFLTPDCIFMEVGPGDCSFSFEVARRVRQVFAIDVSTEISKSATQPANFHLLISDGSSISLQGDSVDVAYSYQLMEHLHPDDALEQVRSILHVLAPGGRYVCISPNRITGPHDISKYFDRIATGFHLKEYTATELVALFIKTGFRRVECYLVVKGLVLHTPVALIQMVESFIEFLPYGLRRKIAGIAPVRQLLEVRVAAVK